MGVTIKTFSSHRTYFELLNSVLNDVKDCEAKIIKEKNNNNKGTYHVVSVTLSAFIAGILQK